MEQSPCSEVDSRSAYQKFPVNQFIEPKKKDEIMKIYFNKYLCIFIYLFIYLFAYL